MRNPTRFRDFTDEIDVFVDACAGAVQGRETNKARLEWLDHVSGEEYAVEEVAPKAVEESAESQGVPITFSQSGLTHLARRLETKLLDTGIHPTELFGRKHTIALILDDDVRVSRAGGAV
jgi:hypothetical protein